ncbi:hypothetical protein QE177_03515 [Arsenophonus sp. aPb]|uniref:hypothetical protein n=1 Tax=Arsenophonus sp. aPb TaxID=3041619 RepID=UPI002468C326|nr:hypothetical protein [Arsenophonus sp. aPb]WGL98977.1 hypothetical protein QE177_03515 [Arsenophonus sp. aPb]
MKIPMMNNTVSSIIESPITETTKSLDDRLKENEIAANYHDSGAVNKKAGVDPFLYTQLRELYEKAEESEKEGL